MQHESTTGGDKIDTGGGPAVQGNVDAGRDFVGRDSAGNVIHQHFNVLPDEPRSRRRRSRDSGELTVAEANALWESINRLSEAVGGLRSAVETNSRETSKLAGAVEDQGDKFQTIDKAISTIQTSLAELGLTPRSQQQPKWKTDLLVWSTTIIAICAFFGLTYVLFGGG